MVHPVTEGSALFAVPPMPRMTAVSARDRSAREAGRALGAMMYVPAHRHALRRDLIRLAAVGTTSVVLCCEDAVPDADVPAAEAGLLDLLRISTRTPPGDAADQAAWPDLWLRPRSPEQLLRLSRLAGGSFDLLTGFVLPKFDHESADAWRRCLDHIDGGLVRGQRPPPLLMPTIETPGAVYVETRGAALRAVADLVESRPAQVSALRLGAADLCGVFGLRRGVDEHVHQIAVISGLIGDVVNRFARPEVDLAVSGPVWEYFPPIEQRSDDHPAVEGLVRETRLDITNGLIGKTVVHPTQVAVVHAASAVAYEQWADAQRIVAAGRGGGAMAATDASGMIESGPHAHWARAVLRRAQVFGVLAQQVTWRDVLRASPAFARRLPAPARWPAPAS